MGWLGWLGGMSGRLRESLVGCGTIGRGAREHHLRDLGGWVGKGWEGGVGLWVWVNEAGRLNKRVDD